MGTPYGMVFGRRRGRVLATGQTTQYSSEQDDGALQKGIAKGYTVLSTGQHSGTSNVDLDHYTGGAGAIAFDNVAKTITDTGNGLALFKTNDVILTDDPDNPGPFTVTTGNVAGTITCTGATFVTGTPAGAVTISKREAHSNNAVLDNNTGLMWARYVALKMGSTSVGAMPWTGQLYDIFAYVVAANAAALGGYSDWRVPNLLELMTLPVFEAASALPDATAFPSFPTGDAVWSSTTVPDTTTGAYGVGFAYNKGQAANLAKTGERNCLLVRGG